MPTEGITSFYIPNAGDGRRLTSTGYLILIRTEFSSGHWLTPPGSSTRISGSAGQ